MHPTIDRLRRELSGSISGLSVQQTQARSAPGKWTVQQVLEHLLLTFASTCTVVETRVEKGTPTKARPSFSQRLGQFTIMRLGLFPTGHLSPPGVLPPEFPVERLSSEDLVQRLNDQLTRLDTLLTKAEQLFGSNRRCISHLRLGPLGINQWRRFHLIHTRHHIRQIEAARRTLV